MGELLTSERLDRIHARRAPRRQIRREQAHEQHPARDRREGGGIERGPVTIENSVLFGQNAAIRSGTVLRLTMKATHVERNGIGVDAAYAASGFISISGSTMIDNDIAFRGKKLKLRSSTISNNDIGLTLVGAGADLGTLVEPGGNTLRDNKETSITWSTDVSTASITASGNTWMGSVQGADGSGHYPAKPLVDGTSAQAKGLNFILTHPGIKIQL